MRRRRGVWSIVALILALAAVPAVARAEDGYDLWLRYAPIESARLRDAYRRRLPASSSSSRRRRRRSSRRSWRAASRGCSASRSRRGRRSPATARSSSAPRVADRVRARLGRGAEEPGAGRIRHPPRAGRRQARARRRLRRRPRRALRHVPPAAAALRPARRSRSSTSARSRATSSGCSITGTTWTDRSSAATPGARCGSGRSCRRRSIRGCTTTRARTRRSA